MFLHLRVYVVISNSPSLPGLVQANNQHWHRT